MDTHEVQPPTPPPPRAVVRSRPSSSSSSGSSGGVEYTSLRDVLAEPGPCSGGGSCGDVIDFDTSNINIRNQLLKHAASAYLQSAIVVAPRERGCLSRLWRRLLQRRRCRILLRPCGCAWPGCGAGDPAHRCAASLAASARRLAAFLSRCVACMWT
ncbi:uncharacterized protein LOC133912941 [Phragmites australis]|uniref:uncharacterized protein LOC133912941 n=1 Tax=Phragmites australis TaxID=29695 RepID=UPI002D77ADE8|nr:uncharacterized protein LOC133912941 [Phragmites australis]